MTARAGPIEVVAVTLPGMPLSEVAVPCEVCGAPRPGTLQVHHGWEHLAQAGVVVVPALATWDAPVPDALCGPGTTRC